ncbi:phosphotransferase enzyme family protein [Bifidobacterium sp.]|uniref:phosphotransferase enzyme family protein n=1 Tax=Bifidobacterium sp. TaxID=41200 RepID=UPI0039EA9587
MISAAQQHFNELPLERQKAHFFDVASRALSRWGYDAQSCEITLLNLTENATFRIDCHRSESGRDQRFVMRVHRLDYAQSDSIEVELQWIEELRKVTELRLATPIPGLDGNCIQSIDCPDIGTQRNVVCFTFVSGSAPRDSTDDTESLSKLMLRLALMPDSLTIPLTRGAAMLYDAIGTRGKLNIVTTVGGKATALSPNDERLYRSIGAIAAILRRDSLSWTPTHRSDIAHRIEWNWDATFGEQWNNYYGSHYWDIDSMLSRHDIEAIDRCRDLMKRRLKAFGTSPERYGIIHSDLRPANLLDDDGSLAVLDFDDCGLGWYMTDIAGIVGFMEHRHDLPAVLDAIVSGYRTVYPLDEQEEREIPTFIMIRRIGLFESLLYHMTNADPGSNEATTITPELVAFVGKGTAILARKYVRHHRLDDRRGAR